MQITQRNFEVGVVLNVIFGGQFFTYGASDKKSSNQYAAEYDLMRFVLPTTAVCSVGMQKTCQKAHIDTTSNGGLYERLFFGGLMSGAISARDLFRIHTVTAGCILLGQLHELSPVVFVNIISLMQVTANRCNDESANYALHQTVVELLGEEISIRGFSRNETPPE